MKKNLLAIFTAIVLSVLPLFAMPGFDSYIPDASGQYVYYRDYSFTRESYIGILTYDEATYQIRYYSPEDLTASLPQKEVALLLTVNPDADFWDMTGERILTTILPDDDSLDIMNYLHDILYDFSSFRNKLFDLSPEDEEYVWGKDFWENGYKTKQNYPLFGGDVTISYDCLIPLFNIKEIIAPDGSVAFSCCTFGRLQSSDDKSFDNFKGFKEYDFSADSRKSKIYKKAKSLKHTSGNHTVTIDKNWQTDSESDNFCTLNEDAVITMLSVPKFDQNQTKNDFFTIRSYLTSLLYSYINLDKCELRFDSKMNAYRIAKESFQPKDGGQSNYINTIEMLTRADTGGFDYFSMIVFKKSYAENTAYFDKIVKSYK